MPRPERAELDALADVLGALANANRLAMLAQLVSPKAIRDIRLNPEAPGDGENPERPISRQAVRDHLLKLEEVGVVRRVSGSEPTEKPWREEYVLSHTRVFAIAEEFRKLCRLRATTEAMDGTQATPPLEGPSGLSGPRLVLVHGLNEGAAFPLAGEGPWVIGRRRGLPVSLDYDAFLSSEHASVAASGPGFELEDLPSSRNGTYLNWRLLDARGKRRLEHGDVIGVGRSLLMFRSR